jgi:2-polyprenyl-6-methoxyphenol hydroxylase-like FAD-dependent oxidoreductase
MTNIDIQVLIAGAGPTGLALACDLARRGIQFRIVDKAPTYFIGSKGKGLQPRSLEVMDDLGVVEQVLRNGKFHIPFRGYDGPKILGERDPHAGRNPAPSTPYASPLITPQWRVEETLRQLLERSGRKVELAAELVALEQNENIVTATLRHNGDEENIRCQYLVAADGGKSFVRKFLQVPFEGKTWKDERMYVGDVRLRGLDRDAWHSWPTHPDGWLALCPLPSTDEYQLQAQVPVGEEREPSLELYQQLVKERTGGMNIELTEAPWLSLYRVNIRMVSRYRIGRVFLAGDAAHVHSPAGGQGMNTGIQDAYNLGWKLGSVLQGAPDALLDTYEEERLPVAANVLGLSTKLYRQITADGEDAVRRDAVTLQLGITYRAMSLSKTAAVAELKLSSGDRAPDAPGLNAKGERTRLFDLFRGPQFTLLRLFGDDDIKVNGSLSVKCVDVKRTPPGKDSSAEIYVDAFGHLAEAYGGGQGEYVLVRPDGYVGWVGRQKTLSILTATSIMYSDLADNSCHVQSAIKTWFRYQIR